MSRNADRILRNPDRIPSESVIECRRNADRIGPENAITWLVAPVVALTDSVVLLRYFLAALSALCFFGAFWTWCRVRPAAGLVGAVLFGSTWLALFYGSEVSPNLYSALGGVALTGLFVQVLDAPGKRWTELGLALMGLSMGLLRPYDLVVVVGGVVVGFLIVMAQNRGATSACGKDWWLSVRREAGRPLLLLMGGLIAGWIPWAIDNTIRFGGPFRSLGRAQAESNVSGWGFFLVAHLRATDGPLLSSTTAHDPVPWGGVLWWSCWVMLGMLGAVLGRRTERHQAVIPFAAGLAATTGYLVFGNVSPRYLLPAYGQLAVAASFGVIRLFNGVAARPSLSRTGVGVAAVLFGLNATWHCVVAHQHGSEQRNQRQHALVLGQALFQRSGGEDCAFFSQYSYAQITLASGCRGGKLDPRASRPSKSLLRAAARWKHVYLLAPGKPKKGSFLSQLPNDSVPVPGGRPWRLYVFRRATDAAR